LASRSILCAIKSTGRRKVRTTETSVASVGQGFEIPKGETAATRSDIEVFFDRLPEPIDLELRSRESRALTGPIAATPACNTVSRASIDTKPAAPEIVLTHLMEGIGIALDVAGIACS